MGVEVGGRVVGFGFLDAWVVTKRFENMMPTREWVMVALKLHWCPENLIACTESLNYRDRFAIIGLYCVLCKFSRSRERNFLFALMLKERI